MSNSEVIHSAAGFVQVIHEIDYNAVRLRYDSLGDETGGKLATAVRAAAKYASARGITNWIADTSNSTDSLSPTDEAWVISSEFRNLLLDAGIKKFVLVPPPPEIGLDAEWISEWQIDSQNEFGRKIAVLVLENETDLRTFFLGHA